MARFDTTGLDDLISDMQRLGQGSGAVAEAMVSAAAAEIRSAWRESAEAHGHRDTGAMIESIGFPFPVQNMGGILYRDIYPQGKDSKGVRNAEKAFILNYGSSRIRPSYWVDEADEKSAPRIQEKLEKMWAEFLDTGRVSKPDDTADAADAGGIHKVNK